MTTKKIFPKKILSVLITTALLFFLLTDPIHASEASAAGLLLWFNTLVPVLLPFFILYADKRTRHDQCVTLDERFADLQERYGHTEAARAGIQASHQQGLIIERAFEAHLGCSLHEDTFDCGRLVL